LPAAQVARRPGARRLGGLFLGPDKHATGRAAWPSRFVPRDGAAAPIRADPGICTSNQHDVHRHRSAPIRADPVRIRQSGTILEPPARGPSIAASIHAE